MALTDEILSIIVCPKCKGGLDYDKGKDNLTCGGCRLVFRVEDDIPVLLLDEADSLD